MIAHLAAMILGLFQFIANHPFLSGMHIHLSGPQLAFLISQLGVNRQLVVVWSLSRVIIQLAILYRLVD